MILVFYAHPYPKHSRACRSLLDAVRDLPGVQVRSLYDLYPDFDIDVVAEQAALARADLIVWLHPIYWYSVPALLKHWFDVVLLRGWAYGQDGTALQGKSCLWVSTTGGDAAAYSAEGKHNRPFGEFAFPVEQTARFCGMSWEEPLTVHGAHLVSDTGLDSAVQQFRARLIAWGASSVPPVSPASPVSSKVDGAT